MGDGFDNLRMCAAALESGNVNLANNLMKEATEGYRSYYSCERVLTKFFAESLARRAYGLHPKRPYSMRRANHILYSTDTFDIRWTAKLAIEDAIKEKNKVHVIEMSSISDYNIAYWILDERRRGVTPLFLKLSLIVHPDDHSEIAKSKPILEYLSEDCCRYSNHVAFDFEIIQVESLVDIDLSRLKIQSDEFVVVGAYLVLGEMLSQPVTLNKFLVMLRDLIKPDLLVIAEREAHHIQSGNFIQRFNESLQYYSTLYPRITDSYACQQLIRYEISNVMACEGSKRVVRHMTFDQWQHLLNMFGFSFTVLLSEMNIVTVSAWKLTQGSKPLSFVEVEDYLSMVFPDTNDFPSYQISPELHCYLIRMASLAEIHDMLQDIRKNYSTVFVMNTWTSCTTPHSFRDTWSSQLNPCLCIADEFQCDEEAKMDFLYWQSELGNNLNRENHVTKALQSNRPCYKAKPYATPNPNPLYSDKECGDGFAVKLSSLHANSSDYVVEFLIEFKGGTSFEEKKSLMNNIVCDLKNKQTIFVTCRTQGPVVELHEIAAISSLDNEINGIDLNDDLPLPQLPHDDQANNAQEGLAPNLLPSRENDLLAQSSGDFELNEDLSFDTWKNQTTRDDMDIDGPHQQILEESDSAKQILQPADMKSGNRFQEELPRSKLQCGNVIVMHILPKYPENENKPFRYLSELTFSSALEIILWEDDVKKLLYCCLTAQFIDDKWKLRKPLLSFKKVEHGSSAMSLTEIINILLSEWNLEKVLSLTVHNRSSLDDRVERRGNWPSKMLLLNYDKCLSDIHYKGDERIILARICEMYRTMNLKGVYPLMDAEINNEQRICSLVLAFVTILNPQLKFRHVKSKYEEIYDGDIAAKEHLLEIYAFMVKHYYAYSSTITADGPDLFELVRYLKEDNLSTIELDILKWWRDNSCNFPTLGKIAREFLAIQLSTVMSCSDIISELMKSTSTKKGKAIAGEEHIKEPKSAWSEQDVKDYLTRHFTEDEKRLLGTYLRKPTMTGEIITRLRTRKSAKRYIMHVTETHLAPLVCPLDKVIIQSTPEKFYVDDTVIEAFFILLNQRYERYPDKYLKHYSFSSFMASKLLNGEARCLSTWYQLEDLVGARKLFQPLCLSNSKHWVLFYVDIEDRRLLWLDSCEGSRKSHWDKVKLISNWYAEVLLPEMGYTDAPYWKVEVLDGIPTQENEIDCGIFVMKYADCLTHGDYLPFGQEDMSHFRKRIFLDIFYGSLRVSTPKVRGTT